MIDVRVDPLDRIILTDTAREKLVETTAFAMQEQERMRSFFATMAYLLKWGRGHDGISPVALSIYPDHTPHSFIWAFTTYRYDDDKRALVPTRPFVILMHYREVDDKWETHSYWLSNSG